MPANSMEEFTGTARFAVVRKLGAGGMAATFLARLSGPEHFTKTVVLKRILSHLAADPEFLSLFLQEARIAARVARFGGRAAVTARTSFAPNSRSTRAHSSSVEPVVLTSSTSTTIRPVTNRRRLVSRDGANAARINVICRRRSSAISAIDSGRRIRPD